MDRLAYITQQILANVDEISRMSCPRCGATELTMEMIGQSIIIRCSVALAEYANEEEEIDLSEHLCKFTYVVRPQAVSAEPFNLSFSKKGIHNHPTKG